MKWKSKIESKLKSKNVKNKGPKGTTNEKERGKQISKQRKSLLFFQPNQKFEKEKVRIECKQGSNKAYQKEKREIENELEK